MRGLPVGLPVSTRGAGGVRVETRRQVDSDFHEDTGPAQRDGLEQASCRQPSRGRRDGGRLEGALRRAAAMRGQGHYPGAGWRDPRQASREPSLPRATRLPGLRLQTRTPAAAACDGPARRTCGALEAATCRGPA